jgi:hypothetical protein
MGGDRGASLAFTIPPATRIIAALRGRQAMNSKYLYLIAALLAFVAAAVTYGRAGPGDDVRMRVVGLAAAGVFLLALGLRKSAPAA